jgi:hypothetical protein
MKKPTPKPWFGICSRVCWNAKGKRCHCKCKKLYHGSAHKGMQTRIELYLQARAAGR